jgi:(p)ppGpp synthase/HD superfamily hydrolase
MRRLTGDALVARAREIAAEAHKDDVDKAGEPYIGHPRRVAEHFDDPILAAAAWLHDVVEDDDEWTLDALRAEGFPDDVVEIVDAVTKRPDESYADAVGRAAMHPLGRRVKAADVADNSDEARLAAVEQIDPGKAAELRKKYALARRILTDAVAGDR